mmetsp:Transcript_27291/g.70802  ORF Transcript_27291/g.70802 Transcript_27291/m.70802 type:complete len:285 (+) Transcript_27291:155-1009(+)
MNTGTTHCARYAVNNSSMARRCMATSFVLKKKKLGSIERGDASIYLANNDPTPARRGRRHREPSRLSSVVEISRLRAPRAGDTPKSSPTDPSATSSGCDTATLGLCLCLDGVPCVGTCGPFTGGKASRSLAWLLRRWLTRAPTGPVGAARSGSPALPRAGFWFACDRAPSVYVFPSASRLRRGVPAPGPRGGLWPEACLGVCGGNPPVCAGGPRGVPRNCANADGRCGERSTVVSDWSQLPRASRLLGRGWPTLARVVCGHPCTAPGTAAGVSSPVCMEASPPP